MGRKFFLAVFLMSLGRFAFCAEAAPESGAVPSSETLTYPEALVLGLVEGVTEFIPVSSTGHLILANAFMDLDSDSPALDKSGEFIVSRKPDADGNPRYYTVKEALDGYAIVIQIAAIAAVALIYWREIASMLMGVFGRDKNGLLLARNLFVAFLPAAVIGLLLHDLIEEFLFGVIPVVAALSIGAFAMIFMQRKYQRHFDDGSKSMEIYELSVRQSLVVGFMQCAALWPGTSRSMMTILGAYVIGLKPVQAAKFSFLLGLVTLSAAGAYKFMKDGSQMVGALATGPMLLGFLVAFASSALAAKWLVGFLSRKGLVPFAVYRLVLAAVLVALIFAHVVD